jgi:aspartate racemase
MKLLGLIGGLTWISTLEYYRRLNEQVAAQLGGSHSAKILLHSIDFDEFSGLVKQNRLSDIAGMLGKIAKGLESAGAEAVLICSNTPHMAAEAIQQMIGVPLIHIAEATAKEVFRDGITTAGLIGTKPTMEQDFFTSKLTEKNIQVLVPEIHDRDYIQHAAFNELGKGQFLDSTRQRFIAIINDLISRGAQGIILGCTEFPFLISGGDVSVPLFDTLKIHAKAAADFSLSA